MHHCECACIIGIQSLLWGRRPKKWSAWAWCLCQLFAGDTISKSCSWWDVVVCYGAFENFCVISSAVNPDNAPKWVPWVLGKWKKKKFLKWSIPAESAELWERLQRIAGTKFGQHRQGKIWTWIPDVQTAPVNAPLPWQNDLQMAHRGWYQITDRIVKKNRMGSAVKWDHQMHRMRWPGSLEILIYRADLHTYQTMNSERLQSQNYVRFWRAGK